MTCDERRDMFLLDAVGALDPTEAVALRAHLDGGCVPCAAAAAEANAIVQSLPLGLPTLSAPANVRDRLMQRIRNGGAASVVSNLPQRPVQKTSRPVLWRTLPLAAAACVGIAVGGGIVWQWTGAARQVVSARDLKYVTLAGSTEQPAGRGRVFWDKDRNDWHVYVFDLKPPATGKQFELWFITADGKKLAAGVFDVDPTGSAHVVAHVPANAGALAAAAITDEPAGGSTAPSGQIQLIGKIE